MDDFPITSVEKENEKFPSLLREIPDCPEALFYRGVLPEENVKLLAVVGSRHYSDYGMHAVETLIKGLRGYPIGIVSGLAIGIDTLAHEAALGAGLYTLAIPGSGLSDEVLYPRRNRGLAHEILETGGGILSEYASDFRATPWSFPRRNRIMAGMTHATLVVEASEKSGTLITSRLATDYNRDVLTIPGSIFSENTKGPHMLIRLGATPITKSEDILEALHLEAHEIKQISKNLSKEKTAVLNALLSPRDRDTLIRILDLDATQTNILLAKMEIDGLIEEHNGIFRKI